MVQIDEARRRAKHALLRNNLAVAAVLFLSWFALNYYGKVTIPAWGALLALALFFCGFFGASYFALRAAFRSLLWAACWTIVTVIISAILITLMLGLGFKYS